MCEKIFGKTFVMKIVIDLFKTGLGNNGGSRTIILCAETLAGLGHEVILLSNVKSRYTWSGINKNVKVMDGRDIPSCDVVIATSPKNVDHALNSPAKRKFYYIRGYEVFWCPKKLVHDGYRKINCIVNSEWLQELLRGLGVKSEIIYPGLDFDIFQNYGKHRKDVLGGLFHPTFDTKQHKHVIRVASSLGKKLLMLNRDLSSPSPKELRDFYNRIKVWMSPTELEGLHNPPMESSLCGCGLVATDHRSSGMSDYAIHEETALVYPAGDLNTAGKFVESLMKYDDLRQRLNDNMVELLREKIGNREDNMKKMLEIIG